MPTDIVRKNECYKRTLRLMGNRFVITVIADDEHKAEFFIDTAVDEIRRIERILTTFDESSQTCRINAAAGISPVVVDDEVFSLIERCHRLSELTQGSFDISYGSLDKRFWNFDTEMTSLPDPETARQAVHLINYRNIILDRNAKTVFLKHQGMRIGFGGIGKGYAAEMARRKLKQLGVPGGVINASGDLATWGVRPDGNPWTIAIANPDLRDSPFSFMDITDMAVATSGNYEKFAIIGGKRYSHTIDPRTGFPVSGIKSVTIICPNAEIADAMATPVTIMGVRAGLHMINQMKHMACIIVDDRNNIYTSRNITAVA